MQRYQHRYLPDHPMATLNGTVGEHRVVAAAHLGRVLLPGEVVHHVNGDAFDNRPENLAVMSNSDHTRLHQPRLHRKPKPLKWRECRECHKTVLYIVQGMCRTCYGRAWSRHRYHPERGGIQVRQRKETPICACGKPASSQGGTCPTCYARMRRAAKRQEREAGSR